MKSKRNPKSKKTQGSKQSSKGIIFGVAAAAIIVGVTLVFLVNSDNTTTEPESTQVETQKFTESQVSGAKQIISECEDDIHCVVNGLKAFSKNEQDEEKIIETFHQLVSLYEENYPCHEVAHHLGMWLYGHIGDVGESLKEAKMICGGAIYHGVIQNFFATEHFNDADPSEINFVGLCPNVKGHPYSIDRWQCLHGLGHGLTVFYENDVFEAVKICEQFEPGWEQISCSKGVFMQNVVDYVQSGDGEFDKNDIYYPCNKVEAKWAPQCYQYHSTYILKQTKLNVFDSYDLCDKIVPDEYVVYCYHGLGRQFEQNIKGRVDNAVELCEAGKQSSYYSDCLRGMVMTVVNGNTNPEQGFLFCKLLPEQYKIDCYDAVGRWVIMLQPTDERRTVECIKAENREYFDICMNASLESLKLL